MGVYINGLNMPPIGEDIEIAIWDDGEVVPMICPKCGKVMKRENNLICTSYPPKYQYTCDNCGQVEYRTVPNYCDIAL